MKTYKICTLCNKRKHIVFFDKDKRKKDGRRSECKECRKNPKQKRNNSHTKNPYMTEEILSMSQIHKSINVKYFGFNIGIILHIRENEYLAFSFTKGSQVFKRKSECKAWLCQQIIKAAEIIKDGLMRKAEHYR